MRAVQPTRLEPESRFKFKCHPGISCFTRCCSDIDIMLTPYDVLRLKKRLGISSEEFIVSFTHTRIDEKSSQPYAYLKMSGDEERRCPFVKVPEGCTVYTDRPVSCRYYPVGQATMKKRENDGSLSHEEFYFFTREEHCKGYEEPDQWTIQSWREDQDAEHYDAMNREWKEVLMRRDMPGQPPLDEKKQRQFFMSSYDLDSFRRYVFESRFLEIFDVDPGEVEQMRTDDVALMKFAFKYIKYIMMMEETLKVKYIMMMEETLKVRGGVAEKQEKAKPEE
jgi:Fe-S-cluster containining protein